MILALLLACAPDPDALPEAAPAADVDAAAPAEAAPADADEAPAVAPRVGSLYALDVPFRTAAGEAPGLDVARGHPVLFSMFYTTCPMACPLLVQDIQALEAQLPPEARDDLRIVLVSLDPAHDDAAALAAAASKHGLGPEWTLGAVPEDRVRDVAAALGVRFRPLPGGGFAHTAVLTLVDGDGRIVARSEGPDGREALVAALAALAEAP